MRLDPISGNALGLPSAYLFEIHDCLVLALDASERPDGYSQPEREARSYIAASCAGWAASWRTGHEPPFPSRGAARRRRVLRGSPAALCIVDPAETPVMRLYREWQATMAAWNAMPLDIPMEDDSRMCTRLSQIEDEMMIIPSQTPKDMAIKMLVGHGFGDHSGLDYDGLAWAEARALIA